jgi:hypothetical protein
MGAICSLFLFAAKKTKFLLELIDCQQLYLPCGWQVPAAPALDQARVSVACFAVGGCSLFRLPLWRAV